MNIHPLASSSSGNCIYISDGATRDDALAAWNTRAETEVEPEDVQQVMESVREVFALSPLIAVRPWVAPTITGRLWIFTEKPTARGELSWLNDGDRYPWTEALFGIPPVVTFTDEPVEIAVSWRVVR
jgi:hypothetical protein